MDSYLSLTNVVAAAISLYALLGPMFFNRKSRSHQENKTVASSLTLVDPRSSPPHNWIHHVFPSFHGEDVRTNVLSHMVKELRSKGIDLFIDNDIERSKSIGPELKEAIRGSRIALVLLSKNYASSTWCLNELVEIIKCKEEFGQTVVVLFYEVDPTHVKKQTCYFGKVFRKTCRGKTKEEIRRWKHALTEVAQIAGYHSTNWDTEAEMIEDIATDVSNKLNLSAPSNDFDGLVGMESKMKELRPLLRLDSNEVRKIGIWGPPGIGKTTIARSLFNRYSQDFQLSVFIDNIKRKHAIKACSDVYSVKLDLQKQFMSLITNEKDIKVPHLGVVKDRLKDKKVLVVLDDVDRSIQVEAMAEENSWFGPGSRIIVTTQDQKVLKKSGIDHIHTVDLPSYDEALQMFCMCAFGQKRCNYGSFSDLAWKVISLVGRLPLGLRVMGSYFRGMSEKDWTKELSRLKIHLDRDGEIESVLKFSYDALRNEEKFLFLHIACFFYGQPVDIVEACLAKSFLDVTQGVHILAEKSLISINMGCIDIDELLFQLGRKIVREQSVSEPGKRQFLNESVDIEEVLSDNKSDSGSVIGINLEEDIACTSERAFERLSNLQFLSIGGNGVNPLSLNYIPRKLKVLSWFRLRMTCFPSSFNTESLVQLDVQDSKLRKLWEENKPLGNLRRVNLSYSRLKELPDLSTATNLQEMNLSHCPSLVRLPFSIGNALNLKKLNMSFCSCLVELPSFIGNMVNLEELDLRDCPSLVELPFSIGNAINLQKLSLRLCSSMVELPSSMRNLRRLSDLYLNNCSILEVNLANINLESLEELNLSYCSLLKSYTESSTEIQERGRTSRLQKLVLRGMTKLVSLPQLPDSVVELDAENCESLESLDYCFPKPYKLLNFGNCFKLNQEARNLIIHTWTKEYAILPATKVPQCFPYQSYGSSLAVKLNQLPLGKSTKFKACFIFAYDENYFFPDWTGTYVCCTITSRGNAFITCNKRIDRVFPGNLFIFKIEVETEEVRSTELIFDFELLHSSIDSTIWKIKECGILPLLEVPLLSLRDVHEDLEASDNESIGDTDECYETSEEESLRHSYEDYEPSDNESN